MALLENMDIDSLCSEDITLPPTPPPPHHPPTITINDSYPLSPEVRVASPNRFAQLQVPTFAMTVEDADGSSSNEAESRVSGSHLSAGAASGGNSEDRPKSVLSIFKGNPFSMITRPLSSLSRRAKSALSNHSSTAFTLPSNLRVRALVRRFTTKVKSKRTENSDDDDFSDASSYVSNRQGSACSQRIKKKLDSLAGSEYGDSESEEEGGDRMGRKKSKWHFICPKSMRNKLSRLKKQSCTCHYYIDPHGEVFFAWMALVTLAYVYNAVAIPLRASFRVHSRGGVYAWLIFDYLCDLVYVLDILVVQCHLSFRHNGVLKRELTVLALHYIKKPYFWVDLLSLLPLDLLYLVPVLRFNSLLRLPRLLKVNSVKVFLDRFESMTTFPHIFRVAKLVSYFLYIIHLYTCVYYKVSEAEGFGINEWVYDGNGSSYLRCLYWGVLTVATAHNLEERNPTTSIEYAVELFGYLFGVFILAVIIGEIRNIVEAANSTRLSAFRNWDRMKELIQQWKLPTKLQDRVQSWHDYSLSQCRTLDEARVLDSLPKKMKADLAIHVHLGTLYKVSLFKDCEKTLLRELVLKLKPALFGPGDYICTKGDIGKEMYIVNQGQVQVVGGIENSEVFAELGPGSVFGEISLLAVGGGNRRTAHVRSKGFSNLFVLSKKDLHETLVDYPDAQETLKKKARYLLRQDKKREHRRSQAQAHSCTTSPPSQPPPPPSTSVPVHSRHRNHTVVAKAAVTAITTAARVARARAAASKLKEEEEEETGEEEGERRRKQCTTQVEVHVEHRAIQGDREKRTNEDSTGRQTDKPLMMAGKQLGEGRSAMALKLAKAATTARTMKMNTPLDSQLPSPTLTSLPLQPEAAPERERESPAYSSLWPSPRDVLVGESPQPPFSSHHWLGAFGSHGDGDDDA